MEASSREAAVALLQRHNLFVTLLEEVETMPFWMRRIRFLRTSSKDIVVFSRQLAIMFKSNVPLLEALHTLAGGFSKNPIFREKILKIAEEIEGGASLSQALNMFPNIFSSFYISMVRSGETSGNLSEDLEYLADHLERDYTFRSKVTGAMVYPIFVLIIVLLVLLGVTTFVIPKMTEILVGFDQELPWVTKVIIAVSNFIKHWIFVLLFLVGGIIVATLRYIKTEEGKKVFDEILLKMPLFGDLARKVYLTRLAENLSTLIAGGLPIAQALEITGEVVGNTIYKKIILETRDEVKKGETISNVFRRYPEHIPSLFTQMTLVGEKSGQLDSVLTNIVGFYQREVDRSLESLLTLLEPIMIIFLGGIVAFLMAAILLPIYQTLIENI